MVESYGTTCTRLARGCWNTPLDSKERFPMATWQLRIRSSSLLFVVMNSTGIKATSKLRLLLLHGLPSTRRSALNRRGKVRRGQSPLIRQGNFALCLYVQTAIGPPATALELARCAATDKLGIVRRGVNEQANTVKSCPLESSR